MAVLDFILNCACLLLWLNWRSRGLTGLPRSAGIALIGTLRRAERSRGDRWPSLVALSVLLLARGIFYTQIGGSLRWMPNLWLGPLALHFRTDDFGRMFLFSLLGFVRLLVIFYFSLMLLAAVNRRALDNDPWMALIRAHLGRLRRCPAWLMLLAPFLITFLFWLVLGPLLAVLKLVTPAKSFQQLAGQAFAIGLGGWLSWQYVIAAVLVLHIVSSYIFLGSAPFWNFITDTARNLLWPLTRFPLRVGRIDLAPPCALLLVAMIALFAPSGLAWLYGRFAT